MAPELEPSEGDSFGCGFLEGGFAYVGPYAAWSCDGGCERRLGKASTPSGGGVTFRGVTIAVGPFKAGNTVYACESGGAGAALNAHNGPVGVVKATATVGSNSSVDFSGLVSGAPYQVVGQDDAGVWRWVSYTADASDV